MKIVVATVGDLCVVGNTCACYADNGPKDVKHIKQYFSLKAWVRTSRWTKPKISIPGCVPCGHVAYQIEGNEEFNNLQAFDLTHTSRVGLKGKY